MLLIERFLLKTGEAVVMIGEGGFTKLSGAAQVNTRHFYQALKEFNIDCAKCVERKIKKGIKERAGMKT